MKQLIIIILIFISVSAEAQTSTYHPFPSGNTVWGYSEHGINGVAGIEKVVLTNTDTLINSVSYRKVNSSTDYLGGFREDTLLKTSFFIPKDSTFEQILYDFDLHTGDTVGPSYIGCYPDVYVSGIDSTNQFGNGYRKVFNLSGAIWAPYSLIEGIGTSGGVFIKYCMNDGYYYQLDCLSINDSLIYSSGAPWVDCNLSSDISSNNSLQKEIKIFPSPVHSTATIEVQNDFIDSEFRIYNSFGQQVKRLEIFEISTKFNFDKFSDGIYFYQIVNENGQMIGGKFVIEN